MSANNLSPKECTKSELNLKRNLLSELEIMNEIAMKRKMHLEDLVAKNKEHLNKLNSVINKMRMEICIEIQILHIIQNEDEGF